MAQLPTPSFYLIANTSDFVRMGVGAVSGGSEYKIFRSELPDYSDEVELYYGIPDLFEDADVEPDTTYYYRAMALANGPGTEDSEYATLTVTTPASNPLNTPVLTLISTDKFFTRWQISPITGAYQYIIERSLEPTFLMPDTFITEDPSWEDGSAQPSTEYFYRVKAVPYPGNGFTNSDWSDVISATTTAYPPLGVPILAASEVTANSVKLTLAGVTGGINYNIDRSIDPLFGSSVSVYFGSAGVYVDQPLIGDATYYYRAYASATSENSQGGFSTTVTVNTLEPEIPNPSDDPIPGLKYFMEFVDINSVSVDVRFYFKGFVGTPLRLTGSPEPVSISYSGFDNDIYEKDKLIADAKYTVNLINPGFSDSFYEDITNINDGDVWVRIQRSSDTTIFSGWLIPDEFSRTFDRTLYEVQLTVVSPFSIMKTREILEPDGKMMFGSKSIADIINACIKSSIHPSLAQRYEVLTTLREVDYVGSLDLFSQLRFFIEAVNDDNGRPPKCFDILSKICNSFGLLLYWINDRFIFIHVYDSLQPSKTIKIKEPGVLDFFTSNTENITRVRGSKEVSVKYEYRRQVGLLPDGRFLQATDNVLNYWYYFNLRDLNNNVIDIIDPSTVVRKGNGRRANPYRMRFLGEISLEGRRIRLQNETWYQGLLVQTPRLRLNDLVTLSINYKYFDWRKKYNWDQPNKVNAQVPYLFVLVLAIPPNNFVRSIQYWADNKNIEGTNIDSPFSDNPLPFWGQGFAVNQDIYPIVIAIDSTSNVQKYESTLRWRFPEGWNMQISILGMRWDYGKPAFGTPWDTDDSWVDVLDVIVSKQTDAEGYNSTGEEIFLTQSIEAAQIDETRDVFLGNFNNPDISGALLKGDNTISKGVARGGTGDNLQNWLVRMIMAQKRTPRYKIDFDFKSSLVRPFDLLVLKEGDDDLLPNKYAIGRYEYNMKAAETKVTCIEINTEDREYKPGGDPTDEEGDYIEEPTSDFDMLETYKTYN